MRLLATRNTGRGVGDFGHLPQYTLIKPMPGFSYDCDVLNRSVRFKSFPYQVCEEDANLRT